MSRRFHIESHRPLLVITLGVPLTLAVALIYMGWRLSSQDRAFELQRIEARREQAAELIVTALHQKLTETERSLADSSKLPLKAEGAKTIVLGIPPRLPEAPADLFHAAEEDEYSPRQDYESAIIKLRQLAASPDSAIQAGALLRWARNLRKAKRFEQALDVYAALSMLDGVGVSGEIPADLVAAHARCEVLSMLGRVDVLQKEARQLLSGLESGRWILDGHSYAVYSRAALAWIQSRSEASPSAPGDTPADIAEKLWADWEKAGRPEDGFSGVRRLHDNSGMDTLLWRAEGERLAVFVAEPDYVKGVWLAGLDSLLASQHVALRLVDTVSVASLESSFETVRPASETKLPWSLHIASTDLASDFAQAEQRRRLLLLAFGLLLLIVTAASYLASRAVSRELKVARLQSDFVAAVSHEFRTPLTSLRQTTEILSDDRVGDPEKLHSYYQTQARATDRLQRLVETLLDFGRMEAGAKPYRLQPLELNSWVRRVVDEFQTDGAVDHRIEIQADGHPCIVDADPEALTHAMRNLLDNAVKYSPNSPTVWVEVEPLAKQCAIRVRDKGIGIPAGEQREVFKKFVRGAAPKSNGIKGTGVGLAMVQHIVHAHHGEIRVESEPGRGSTFTLLLPESGS